MRLGSGGVVIPFLQQLQGRRMLVDHESLTFIALKAIDWLIGDSFFT